MSYMFNIRAATKAEAKEKVAAELEKVVAGQSNHKADQAQAQAAADSFIDVLANDDSKEIFVSMNGSLSWMSSHPETYTGVGCNISVTLKTK